MEKKIPDPDPAGQQSHIFFIGASLIYRCGSIRKIGIKRLKLPYFNCIIYSFFRIFLDHYLLTDPNQILWKY